MAKNIVHFRDNVLIKEHQTLDVKGDICISNGIKVNQDGVIKDL